MPEQQSTCHRHVELLDAIGAKNNEEAKQMVNGMRVRLHTALNDAAGATVLLESIRTQLKCETVLDIPEAMNNLPNETKELIINRLHETAAVCTVCCKRKCAHGSSTTLPGSLDTDAVLRAINLDEFFFREAEVAHG